MAKPRVTVVVDTTGSWMNEYAEGFVSALAVAGYNAVFCREHEGIPEGGIAIFLSCEKIVRPQILSKSKHNLVLHASDLPAGRGWSPITWQVLEGKNRIPVTLFEAGAKIDNGPYYYKDALELEGHELIDEIRKKLVEKTLKLVLRFLREYPNVKSTPQQGKESSYRKRMPADSELDINRPLGEQVNLLRVVDNERYPAFFRYKGHGYMLKIHKKEAGTG
jgi:methionyl-tRNA formyltransferase